MTEDINLEKDLRARYKFDAEWFDGNDLLDRSSNRYHATAEGSVTVGQQSPIGGAATFDGSDDQFNLPQNIPVSDGFTVFAMAKCYSANQKIYIYGNIGGPGGVGLRVSSNGEWQGLMFDGDGNLTLATKSTGITAGTWHTISVTWDQEELTLVVDGEYEDTTPVSSTEGEGAQPAIGTSYINSGRQYWEGEIAAVLKWQRALNGNEIEAIHNMKGPMVQRL